MITKQFLTQNQNDRKIDLFVMTAIWHVYGIEQAAQMASRLMLIINTFYIKDSYNQIIMRNDHYLKLSATNPQNVFSYK